MQHRAIVADSHPGRVHRPDCCAGMPSGELRCHEPPSEQGDCPDDALLTGSPSGTRADALTRSRQPPTVRDSGTVPAAVAQATSSHAWTPADPAPHLAGAGGSPSAATAPAGLPEPHSDGPWYP